MDSFYFNKIAGALLSCLVVLVGARTFVEILYPKGEENVRKTAIVVTQNPVPAAGEAKTAAAVKSAEPDKPVELLLASANPDAGATAAKKCAACHVWSKENKNGTGPGLYGVVGREIAKHPGFQYSATLSGKGGQWTPENIYGFIKNPKQWAPGTKMAFAGIENGQERANIIAYLNKQSDTPVAFSQK